MNFVDIIFYFESLGAMDVIIPFFLIFTAVYAVAQRVKQIKRFAGVISFIMALSAIIPHVLGTYPPCRDVVVIIMNALPRIGIMLVIVITFFLVILLVGVSNSIGKAAGAFIVGGSLIYIIYAFLSQPDPYCQPWFPWMIYIPWLDYLLAAGVIVGIVWFVTRKSESDDDIY